MKIKSPGLKFRKEYFPFLLPFFIITHYYIVNYPFFSSKLAAYLFFKYLLTIFLLNFLFFLFLKSWRKSSLFTFFILCAQFFFIFLYEFLLTRAGGTILSKEFFILAFLILVSGWVFLRLKRFPGSLSKLVNFLNILVFLWIFTEFVKFISLKNYLATELKKTVLIPECGKCEKPDIYLLVLDEYAGQKELIDQFQFDNAEFLSYLRNKNFYIVPSSKSNYNLTLFSMASMFSLDTLTISNYKKPQTKDYTLAALKINNSPFGHFLQKMGYDIYNLSIFNFLDIPPIFGGLYTRDFGKEFELRTLTGRIQNDNQQLFFQKPEENEKENSLNNFNYNKEISNFLLNRLPLQSSKPKFIYAHFLMPHFPHLLNEKGQFNDLKSQYSEHTYLGYLKYCNLQLTTILNKILSSSAPRPVILLMSDHGFRGFSKTVDRKYYFMNLNAIYLPDQDYGAWYNGVSNVNQLRLLLNQKFNQKLPLLKDSSFQLMNNGF
jgi:hypothetical protein